MSEGKYYGSATLKDGSRVQLTQGEAAAIMAAVDESKRKRVEIMPNTAAALSLRSSVDQRLRELGWRDDLPRSEGEEFALLEHGSAGIFLAVIHGEFVHYAGCVGGAEDRHRYKHKVLDKLTDDERATMTQCDADNREWLDRELKSFAAMEVEEVTPATLTAKEAVTMTSASLDWADLFAGAILKKNPLPSSIELAANFRRIDTAASDRAASEIARLEQVIATERSRVAYEQAAVSRLTAALEEAEKHFRDALTAAGMVVLAPETVAFLDGSAPLNGMWFGDVDDQERAKSPSRKYWWRKYLRAMTEAYNGK